MAEDADLRARKTSLFRSEDLRQSVSSLQATRARLPAVEGDHVREDGSRVARGSDLFAGQRSCLRGETFREHGQFAGRAIPVEAALEMKRGRRTGPVLRSR